MQEQSITTTAFPELLVRTDFVNFKTKIFKLLNSESDSCAIAAAKKKDVQNGFELIFRGVI